VKEVYTKIPKLPTNYSISHNHHTLAFKQLSIWPRSLIGWVVIHLGAVWFFEYINILYEYRYTRRRFVFGFRPGEYLYTESIY
jgi:hypothetical protein